MASELSNEHRHLQSTLNWFRSTAPHKPLCQNERMIFGKYITFLQSNHSFDDYSFSMLQLAENPHSFGDGMHMNVFDHFLLKIKPSLIQKAA